MAISQQLQSFTPILKKIYIDFLFYMLEASLIFKNVGQD